VQNGSKFWSYFHERTFMPTPNPQSSSHEDPAKYIKLYKRRQMVIVTTIPIMVVTGCMTVLDDTPA
jgi:hypothetical protein